MRCMQIDGIQSTLHLLTTGTSPTLSQEKHLAHFTSSNLMAIPLGLDVCPALLHTRAQVVQQREGLLERDTSVRDAHAVLEAGGALGRHRLLALVDVALNHDTHNGLGGGSAGRKLGGDILPHNDLALVLL